MGEPKYSATPCHGCGGDKLVGDGRLCATCRVNKEKKKAASQRAWARRIETTYGISDEDYFALLAAQDGCCFICLRKPGKRRLAVDHDHSKEVIKGTATRESIRGLLCRLSVIAMSTSGVHETTRMLGTGSRCIS